ncbi:MAG: hypothetical protein Pg6A_01490 [Termitinemataceae bacterium]|jgi:hypothetical protein|nr:MAG: hypothetical protein Pg6A_01490 [Termitinemataceae bacterium]
MKKLFLIIFISHASLLQAIDIWSYPEAAEGWTIYASVLSPGVSWTEGFFMDYPVGVLDFVLPFGLPFSIGIFVKTPEVNLKSFGLRAAYHIDIDSPKIDLYFLYLFDFGWTRNALLVKYNDTPSEVYFYDFRAGIRRLFGKYIALTIESGFKFRSIYCGLSIKLN